MKKPIALLCVLSAPLLLSAQASQGPMEGTPAATIESYLQSQAADHTFAGAVVLVATKDSVIYVKAVGYRDLANKALMAPNDMFWIASTSKPMTATALMMLVDEGKVNLDDPVEKYLPEFHGQMVSQAQQGTSKASGEPTPVPANHPILVREILSHTSGLPFKSKAQPGALDTLPLKDQVRSFAAEPLMFQPFTSYSYSNEGLDTAARIIEVVTGIPYEQFMQQRLFDPLGMTDTTFWPSAKQIARLAKTYKFDEKTQDLIEVPIDQLTYPLDDRQHRYPMPAGGLFSNAEDVSKFCRMILNGGTLNGRRYLSVNAVREMTSVQNMGLGGSDYGFGWGISAEGMGHGGAYNNAMEISRTKGRILIFMVQQNGSWGTAQGKTIVKTLEPLAESVAASADVPNAAAEPEKH